MTSTLAANSDDLKIEMKYIISYLRGTKGILIELETAPSSCTLTRGNTEVTAESWILLIYQKVSWLSPIVMVIRLNNH